MINIIKIYNLEVIIISVFLCFFLNKIFKKLDLLLIKLKKEKFIINLPPIFRWNDFNNFIFIYDSGIQIITKD